jgi:hypothetical protein
MEQRHQVLVVRKSRRARENESVDGEGADGVDGCCCRGGETVLL